MLQYRVETTLTDDKKLLIKGLPFHAGEKVEVIVRSYKEKKEHTQRYPLRGKPFRYVDPFASVAENDWEVIK